MTNVTIDAHTSTTPLFPYWNRCVGAGRANEGLRAAWQQQLRRVVVQCGFRYIRFHGLFHDDMFVYREKDETPVHSFHYIDELFDALLSIGIRPFVEFGFCPRDLAVAKETVFWWKAHGSLPRDTGRWCDLIEGTVRHWIRRYGASEVRQWYFEVWNEPNIPVFFKGSQEEYFHLYGATVRTLKAIDPDLRVGGPATSNFYPERDRNPNDPAVRKAATFEGIVDLYNLPWRGVWIEEFLDFCDRTHLPVDFVSTHPYPTDFALDGFGKYNGSSRPCNSLRRDLHWVREVMKASPYADAELHCTEWSSSPSPVDHTHDYPQAATYVAKSVLEASGYADSLSYWVFSDIFEEQGAPPGFFHGGFGMINRCGIAKPVFHVYRFLNQLGDVELTRGEWGIATRHTKQKTVSTLLYNYPSELSTAVPVSIPERTSAEKTLHTGSAREYNLTMTNLAPHAPVTIEILDSENGTALTTWQAMDSPDNPTPEQLELLRKKAEATATHLYRADENGHLGLHLSLNPWAVALVKEFSIA